MSLPLPVRIAVKLYYKIWRVVWYPLAIVWRRVFGITVTVGFAYILWTFFFSEDELGALPPPPGIAVPATPGEPPKPTAAKSTAPIEPVRKVQDGNSIFSADLIPAMRGEELQHYSRTFYYVMDHLADGARHDWHFFNIHGAITPTSTFTNNLGDSCRRFDETLKVHDTQQTIEGIACEKRGGGWCKLRPNSTPACDLGRKSGIGAWWFDTKRDIGDWFR